MEKVLVVLTLVSVLLLTTLSWGIEIKSIPNVCISWVNAADSIGIDNGQKVFDYWYSSCRTPSDNPQIFAIRYKTVFTPFGKQLYNIPANVSSAISDCAINYTTGQSNFYSTYLYDSDNQLIGQKSYLKDGDLDPSIWENPSPGSALEHVIQVTRSIGVCAPCTK